MGHKTGKMVRWMGVTIPNPWASMLVMGETGVLNLSNPLEYVGTLVIRSATESDLGMIGASKLDATLKDLPGTDLAGWDGFLLGTVFLCGPVTKSNDPYATGPHMMRVVDPMAFSTPVDQAGPSDESWPIFRSTVANYVKQAMTPDDFRARLKRSSNRIPPPETK